MGYCFMSIDKINNDGKMVGKYNHNYRTVDVPNADPKLASQNDEIISLNGLTYAEAFEKKINELDYYKKVPGVEAHKIRKNAVKGLEILMTFSKEDLEHVDIEKWKKDNIEWLQQTFNVDEKKYGNNVLSAMFHGDEAGNVHIHAFVVPIDDKGHLNASYFIDGPEKMAKLQTSYGKMMKERHGLNRGLEGSKATHNDMKRFYAAVNQEIKKEVPKPKEKETIEEYYNRVNELYKDLNLKLLDMEMKYKRKHDEFKTISINDKIEMEKTKNEIADLKKLLDKLGNIDTAINKINTINKLNSGIQNYPDQEYALEVLSGVKKIIAYEESIEKTNEEIEKLKNKMENKTK